MRRPTFFWQLFPILCIFILSALGTLQVISYKSLERSLRAVLSGDEASYLLSTVFWEWSLGALILFLLLLGASLWVTRRFVKPLQDIKTAAPEVANGNFKARIQFGLNVSQEIYDLAEALTEAAQEMQFRMRTIDKQRKVQAAVLSSMAEGVIAVDDRDRIRFMNLSALELLESSEVDVRRRPVEEVVRFPKLLQFIRQALSAEGPLEAELEIFGRHEKTLYVRSRPLFRSEGHNQGIVLVLSDLTRLKMLESHRKDFVANVSHELRTPLTAIQGYAETLLNPQVVDVKEKEKFAATILKQSQRLSQLIDDLLTLSRLDDPGEGLEFRPVKASVVARSALEITHERALARNINVTLETSSNPEILVQSTLLEQAVGNLLENAIKYSPTGSRVRLEVGEEVNQAFFKVKDEGPGISKEHLDRLFERFYRVDKARSREVGGTGLGLSIVKNVALAHKGQVEVKSEPGQGSEFTIFVPVHDPHPNLTKST